MGTCDGVTVLERAVGGKMAVRCPARVVGNSVLTSECDLYKCIAVRNISLKLIVLALIL